MATMIAEVYDAFKAARAPEEKAQAAATVLANSDDRFNSMDTRMGRVESDLAVVKAELAMVKWIVSGVGFGVLLLVLRSFWPGA